MAEIPQTVEGVRQAAFLNFSASTRAYFESGADDEQTLHENTAAFNRLLVRQKIIGGINDEDIDTIVELFGHTINSPICVAPTGMRNIAHSDGETGAAKATQGFGTCLCVSTSYCISSSTSFDNLLQAARNGFYWLQLYIFRDRSVTERVVRQAEMAGFKAIVLTVDSTTMGFRIANLRKKEISHSPVQPTTSSNMNNSNSLPTTFKLNFDSGKALFAHVTKNYESDLSWQTVAWLRSITKLPIILKGILTYEDAVECLKHDVQGIYVSNHGGRQLDYVSATIEALPEVVRAVQGKIPVFVDGGIRKGSDVFKALALGAKAVFIGRPIAYGLGFDGQHGAELVLKILSKELRDTMKKAACRSIKDIKPIMLTYKRDRYDDAVMTHTKRNWQPNEKDVLCIADILYGAKQRRQLDFHHSSSSCYERLLIRPRFLQGISKLDPSIDLFGHQMKLPLLISSKKMAQQDHDFRDTLLNVATLTDACIVVEAHDAVTLHRCADQQHGIFMVHLRDFTDKNTVRNALKNVIEIPKCVAVVIDVDADMKHRIEMVKECSPLPVLVKHISSRHDALMCCSYDVQGLVVTEYGLLADDHDFMSESLDVLGDVVRCVNNQIPVFYEGNVMRGSDVFKAIALGAKAVFLDQQFMWGYILNKEAGVKKVFEIFNDEFERVMMLAGCGSIRDIVPSMVVHRDHYWRLMNEYCADRDLMSHL